MGHCKLCPGVEACFATLDGIRRLIAGVDDGAVVFSVPGFGGRSNHAHENEAKGKGLKLDDRRAMPLCVDDMGKTGCHTAFDQYALVDGGRDAHVELGRAMAKHTRQIILKVGKWPKGLSLWPEDTIETGSAN